MDTPEIRYKKYMNLLDQQSSLNRYYAKKNQQYQEQIKYDIQPVAPSYKTQEEELNDVNLQRNKAYEDLQKIVKIEVAKEFILSLDDEEIVLFNQVFSRFKEEIRGFKNLDNMFLSSLWNRFLDKIQVTGGISIPLEESSLKPALLDAVKEEEIIRVKTRKDEMYKTRIQNKIQTLVNNISIKELSLENLYKEKNLLPNLLERDVGKVNPENIDVINKIRERYNKKDESINKKITNLLNSISEMENKKTLLENDLMVVKEEEIVGKGLKISTPEKLPKYVEFGRYIIHVPSLHENFLNLKYPSKGLTIHQLPRTKISNSLKNVLFDALENKKLSQNKIKHLEKDELRLLKKACDLAHIEHHIYIKQDEEEFERFDLLRGQVQAGNDNPDIIKELKLYLHKFLADGRIKRHEFNNVMYEIMSL